MEGIKQIVIMGQRLGMTIEEMARWYREAEHTQHLPMYNVKGRNDREVEHLVIYNF